MAALRIETPKGKRAESGVHLHTFRHTAATRLFRGGWNAVQMQRFLGHTDPGFTLRTYVHLLARTCRRCRSGRSRS